jgi:PBP1b-binding outer membrane lipoprotein LpoB
MQKMNNIFLVVSALVMLLLSGCNTDPNANLNKKYSTETPTQVDLPQMPSPAIGPPPSTKSSSGAQYVF